MRGGEGSPFLAMPELSEESYLVGYWHEAGTCSSSGMGISPLTWQELRAWKLESGYQPDHLEMDLVRQISTEYCNEYHAASDKKRPAPYSVTEESFDRVALSNKIGNVLDMFGSSTISTTYEVVDRE